MSTGSDQIGKALESPIPDVFEPIIGYRYWKWDDYGLRSANGTQWHPGEPVKAKCVPRWSLSRDIFDRYVPPTSACTGSPSDPVIQFTSDDINDIQRVEDPIHGEYGCGVYAYSTPADAWSELGHLNTDQYVLGSVKMWGKVWPHERGYRSEHAQVASLFRLGTQRPTIWGDPLERLAAFYGVEVEEYPLSEEERDAVIAEKKERFSKSSLGLTYDSLLNMYRTHGSYLTSPIVGSKITLNTYGSGGNGYVALAPDDALATTTSKPSVVDRIRKIRRAYR